MIQFNLLPDIKLQFVRAKRQKRNVVVISGIAGAVSLLILVSLVTVNAMQKKHLGDVNNDIKKYTSELKAIPELDKVLTVQNQLKALPELHSNKPVTSRIFGYLSQITPAKVNIASLVVGFDAGTMTLTGSADNLTTINQFVDTLKFTSYTVEGETVAKKPFSEVVLSNFGRADKDANYTITLKFENEIFNNAKKIALTVPKIITTRSETERPGDLFKQQTPPSSDNQNGAQ